MPRLTLLAALAAATLLPAASAYAGWSRPAPLTPAGDHARLPRVTGPATLDAFAVARGSRHAFAVGTLGSRLWLTSAVG